MNFPILFSALLFLVMLIFIFKWLLKKQKLSKPITSLHALFEKIISENNLLIHYKDVFDKKLIGFDKQSRKLLLLDLTNNHGLSFCLDMDKINACSINHVKEKSSQETKNIFLELHAQDNTPVQFCFYDKALDDARERTCLLLKAQHWNQRINFHKKYWWANAETSVCN